MVNFGTMGTFLLVKVILLLMASNLVIAVDLYCPTSELAVSESIKPRLMDDTANRVYVFDDPPLDCYGRVESWIYYTTKDQPFKAGIYRETYNNYYILVGENLCNASADGLTETRIPKAERVQFQPGDRIGFRHASPALDYDMGLDAVSMLYASRSDFTTEHEFGAVLGSISTAVTRGYSLKAVFEDRHFERECAANTHGSPIAVRSSNDGGNLIHMIYGNPFNCFGHVKAWKFWAESRNGGFKAGVYRPDSDSDTDFILLGETEVPADHPLGEEYTYEIQNQEDWISIQPGDIIGFRWYNLGSGIRFDSGTESVKIYRAGHSNDDYDNKGIGDTFSVSTALNRAYSIQAVLSPQDFKGCFDEDWTDREFATSAGNFDPNEMTPEFCIRECAQRSYLYAGLQESNQCYCSNSYGTHSGGGSDCDMDCTGNPNLKCGGYFKNQVFSTPPVMIGFSVDDTALTRTYFNADFGHNVTSGYGVVYSYDFGDGFSVSDVTAMNMSHVYGVPGDYAVVTTATDPWKNTDNQIMKQTIESEVTEAKVECPPAVEYDKRYACKFYIYQGTNMSVQINFTDGRVIDFDIEDAETIHYGDMFSHDTSLSNQPASKVYLKINDVIMYDGRLVAWEFNAIATGDIVFQVYRPRCESIWRKFCYRSFSCIPLSWECQDEGSIWLKNCSTSGRFSFTRRDCVVDESLQRKHLFDAIPIEYDYVGEFPYTIETLGRNFMRLELADHLDVFKGDIIGWYNSDAGKIGYVEVDAAVEGDEFLPDMTGFDSRNTDGFYAATTGATAHNYKHSLKAHVVRPSELNVYHNYTWPDNRQNISIMVNSTYSKETFGEGNTTWIVHIGDEQQIKVQEYIKNLSFVVTNLAVTTEEETLYVEDHPGTEVTYHWWFGNGDFAVTTENSVNYTWPDDGVYIITLMAYNDISWMVIESWVVLQHRITNFTWLDSVPPTTWPQHPVTPKIFGNESVINFGMYKGTNITYEISIGDDIVPTFFMPWYEEVNITELIPDREDDLAYRLWVWHNGTQGSVVTTYESIGYFPVYINASNRVSWSVLETLAIVQVEITRFRIVKPPPMVYGTTQLVGIRYDTGTNLTIMGSFNNISLDLTNQSLYAMNDAAGEGYVVIGPDKYDDRGFYPVEFTTWNLVSGPYTDSILLRIEFAITDYKMWTSEIYVIPGTPISFSFDMEIGSDLTFTIDYDDGTEPTVIETLEMKRPLNDSFTEWHDYDVAADYNVTIWASSCVSNETVWTFIKVQNPVDNVTMKVYTPGVIPYMDVGQLRHDFTFGGNQYGPPTDAEVNYRFDKYRGKIDVQYEEDFPIQDYNPVVQNMTLWKHGTYDLRVNISNLVSWMLFTAEINMERPIINFTVACPFPHIKVHRKARLIATMDWGSRVSYYWDFKDGSLVNVDIAGETDRKHMYREPGTYYVTVYASNLLGHVSYTLPDPVKVQWAVRGFEWTGRRLNRLYTNKGFTSVPFEIHMAQEIPFPTEAIYEIDWGDGSFTDPANFTQDGANPDRDTDIMFHI